MAGLPEEIAHIAVAHSPEGDNVKRSLECIVVHQADVAWWTVAAAAGLIERETFLEFADQVLRAPAQSERAAGGRVAAPTSTRGRRRRP